MQSYTIAVTLSIQGKRKSVSDLYAKRAYVLELTAPLPLPPDYLCIMAQPMRIPQKSLAECQFAVAIFTELA